MFWDKDNKKKKEIKKLLKEIDNSDVSEDFDKIVNNFLKIIHLDSNEPTYWEDLISFIYFNYQYTEPYDWDDLLLKSIKICQDARKHIQVNTSLSMFFLFEFKLTVELIKFDFSFSQDYDEETLENLLNSSIKANPLNSFALEERANLYQGSGEYEKAEVDYEKAISLKENITTLYDMALNNQLMGKNAEAIALYIKLYEKADDSIIKKIALEGVIKGYKVENNREKQAYYQNLLNKL